VHEEVRKLTEARTLQRMS